MMNIKKWITIFFKATVESIKISGWIPLGIFIGHIVAVYGFNIYNVFPSFDIPMHFLGGVGITYFYVDFLKRLHQYSIIKIGNVFTIIILLFCMISTTTVLWEFLEWIIDYCFNTHAQVSLDDTMLDMFLGILGGTITIIIRKNNYKL